MIVPAPVITSARRWQKLGLARTTLINHVLVLAWFAGVPHTTLAQLYRCAAASANSKQLLKPKG